MADTFRTSKLEKFIQKKVDFMEGQQRAIEMLKKEHGPLSPIVQPLEYNQNALYNYTFELCQAFGIDMPHVLGVTPK